MGITFPIPPCEKQKETGPLVRLLPTQLPLCERRVMVEGKHYAIPAALPN